MDSPILLEEKFCSPEGKDSFHEDPFPEDPFQEGEFYMVTMSMHGIPDPNHEENCECDTCFCGYDYIVWISREKEDAIKAVENFYGGVFPVPSQNGPIPPSSDNADKIYQTIISVGFQGVYMDLQKNVVERVFE